MLNAFSAIENKSKLRFRKRRSLIYSGILFSFCVGFFAFFEIWHTRGYIYEVEQKIMKSDLGISSIRNIGQVFKNPIHALTFDHQKLPLLEIQIKPKSLRKLISTQNASVKLDFLDQSKWVKASILEAGKSLPVKIRLKGLLSDHWRSFTRASLKIKMIDDGAFLNKREFAIHKPKSRQFPYSDIFSKSFEKSWFALSIPTIC